MLLLVDLGTVPVCGRNTHTRTGMLMSGASPDLALPDAELTSSADEEQRIRNLLTDLAPFPMQIGALCTELRRTNHLLRRLIPKRPEAELVTLQTGVWWKAHKRGYTHLRILSAIAITISADCPGIGAVPFALAAASVTEFFLPENSLLTVSNGGSGPGGSQPVLMIWDDISS